MVMLIDVSPGEVIDRLTILEIKLERIADPDKGRHVLFEYEQLSAALASNPPIAGLEELRGELKAVNSALWLVEDELRDHERCKDFGPAFVELARSVYHHNDHRSAIKRKIGELAGSAAIDVKSYASYWHERCKENVSKGSQELTAVADQLTASKSPRIRSGRVRADYS
jgi:Family of unknown function (DUF6165)